jgi:hypothetical protein
VNSTNTPATATVLWTIRDVAHYYQRSERQARRIVEKPGFPPPAQGDRHRWSAAHVIAWAEGPEPTSDSARLQRRHPAGHRVGRRPLVTS